MTNLRTMKRRKGKVTRPQVKVELTPCPHCNGEGGHTVYDSVPYGSTWVSMPSWADCPQCIDLGLCPKCMNKLDDDNKCTVCKFDTDSMF